MEVVRLRNFIVVILFVLLSNISLAKEKKFSDFEHKEPIPIPEFNFLDKEGNHLTLSSFRGKVLLVNFWATWCVPCIKEMPDLSKLSKEFEGNEVIILPISLDRNKSVKDIEDFYKKHKVDNLPVYLDFQGSTFRTAQLRSLPTTILVDKSGYEIARVLGVLEWLEEINKNYILSKVEY